MSGARRRWDVAFACLVAVAVLTIVIFGSLNYPGGQVKQVVGIVRSYGFIQYDGPPTKVVSVQLQSGVVVQARSTTNLVVKSGDAVRVNVYRRMFTGSETFILVGIEPK